MHKDIKYMKRQLEDLLREQHFRLKKLDSQNTYFHKIAEVSKAIDKIMEMSED